MKTLLGPEVDAGEGGPRGPWPVYGALAALLLLLAGNALVGYRNALALRDEAAAVVHTQEVLEALDGLMSAAKDAETGQRGFIITGDPTYLEPFEAGAPRVGELIEQIAQLTADNPGQQARLPRVRASAAARLELLRQGIAQRKSSGFDAARELTESGRGRQEMAALHTAVQEMRAEELDLLRERAAGARSRFAFHIALFLVPSLAAALLVALVVLQLRRFLRARAAAAAAVAAQRELLKTTLASIGDGVISTDTGARVTFLNPVAEQLTEWSLADAAGRELPEVFKIVDEASREPLENPALRALREGMAVGLASRTVLVARTGTERPIDDRSAPIKDRSGTMRGAVLVFRDISERRAAEREIQRLLELEKVRSERLRQVAAAGSTLLSSLSPDSVLGVVETQARAIIGSAHAKVLSAAEVQPTERDLAVTLPGRGGKPLGVLLLSEKVGGRFDQDDQAILTQLAQLAAIALENARLYEELREGDRRKDEFLATVAHELRNPLAPLRNAVEIIRLAPGDEDAVQQALGTIGRQTAHLARLVDDLLDLSRISQGKIAMVRERLVLADVIAHAVETSRSVIDAGHHALHVDLPSEDVILRADGTRLIQVLSNLINNAAKYMAPGGNIFVTATVADARVAIVVRDEGIGIPADMLGRIFELFVQVGDGQKMSQGGLGVGLTLVQRIVQMHGGTVEARSRGQGQGSEFVVTMPLLGGAAPALEALSVPASKAPPSADGVPARRVRRVLVVDDNVDSVETMTLLLRKLGHEVRSGADGLEAVALAEEFRPDLILLDLGLPGLNGYEAAVRIRQLLGGGVTLVAMTGWGRAEDLKRSQEAGFDRHLVKPLDFRELEELLSGA